MTGWWSQERILETINQTYIEKELGNKRSQDSLHRVLAFGDGLTDDTYLDWILERSPRFFLILNDIGVPERIFEVIDRSFDDDDLPLSQDALWELNLFGTTSETLDKKFYRQQFYFLIHDLEPGGHVDYGEWDVVPVEPVAKKPGIPAAVQNNDRVSTNGQVYTRKKIPTSGDSGIDRIRFIMHLKSIAALQHRHLITVWATYTQEDFNYVLLKPSCDITLKHVLEEKDSAKQFKALEKHERRQLLLTWVHCLLSALAYLHSRGFVHKAIRPSTISIDHNNVIYLNDYNALRVLDVDESPNSYSGEVYDFAAPEHWQRKPTLHETAPLKTLLPGGGRTSRKIPKGPGVEPESRRPSLTAQDLVNRPHSRSQNSSSGSSNGPGRPRNALITTFQPPDTTPTFFPNRYFPGDIFSMSAVIIMIFSYLLGHGPKTFAAHRSRLNRQAGRGNGPPDASFHKNLQQVEKWLDMLRKEAGQKEKKDQKFWGAMVELIGLCKRGISKEADDRPTAERFEKKVLGWVEYGIGRRRKCECSEDDRTFEEPEQPHPVVAAQRQSILSWSKIGERISSGLESGIVSPEPSIRPRRSISQRLSLDRAPELRRPRHARPPSSLSGPVSSLSEEPLSPTAPSRRQSEKIRSAVRHAVQTTAPGAASNAHEPKVIHQGRSTYRARPKKPAPISAGRRNTHPLSPPPRPIREEPDIDSDAAERDSEVGIEDDAQPFQEDDEAVSAYTLQPRRRTHPMTNGHKFPQPPPRQHQRPRVHRTRDSLQSSTPSSIQPSTPSTSSGSSHAPVIHGIPLHDEDEEIGVISGSSGSLIRHASLAESEVWGLGNVLEDNSSFIEPAERHQMKPPATKGRHPYRKRDDDDLASLHRLDWPLPPMSPVTTSSGRVGQAV